MHAPGVQQRRGRVPLSQFPLLGWLKMPCGLHMSTCSKQRRPARLLSDRSARGVTCVSSQWLDTLRQPVSPHPWCVVLLRSLANA